MKGDYKVSAYEGREQLPSEPAAPDFPFNFGDSMARDRWGDLCSLYAVDDGLPVRDVGSWTADKLYFWHKYVDITTSAMVGHPAWKAGLAYIDLFGGPGICRLDDAGTRVPGSALIAANAAKPFHRILVSELNPTYAHALDSRLKASPASQEATVFPGDCNQVVHEMVRHIPRRALTLAFIDPESIDIRFSTVQTIANCGRVDLLVLFADRMDLVRNVDLYEKQNDSAVDHLLGDSSWRARWQQVHNRSAENICAFFAEEFRRKLQEVMGYHQFGEEVLKSARGPLYRIIFASKAPKGLEFWNKITNRDRSGQKKLF